MILIALDVDGTLDCAGGPVPVALLEDLNEAEDGPIICIVSPSPAYSGDLARISDGARDDNLRRFAATVPQAHVRLYVSDNQDHQAAHAAGFALVHPDEFVRGLVRPAVYPKGGAA